MYCFYHISCHIFYLTTTCVAQDFRCRSVAERFERRRCSFCDDFSETRLLYETLIIGTIHKSDDHIFGGWVVMILTKIIMIDQMNWGWGGVSDLVTWLTCCSDVTPLSLSIASLAHVAHRPVFDTVTSASSFDLLLHSALYSLTKRNRCCHS